MAIAEAAAAQMEKRKLTQAPRVRNHTSRCTAASVKQLAALMEPMIVNINMAKARLDSFILDHCSDGLAIVIVNSNWSLLGVKVNGIEEM